MCTPVNTGCVTPLNSSQYFQDRFLFFAHNWNHTPKVITGISNGQFVQSLCVKSSEIMRVWSLHACMHVSELSSGAGGEFFYPSIGSQVLLVAQFKRLFLLFLPIVPSEQTEALPAAQKPANSLQRHSNEVSACRLLLIQVGGFNTHGVASNSDSCGSLSP